MIVSIMFVMHVEKVDVRRTFADIPDLCLLEKWGEQRSNQFSNFFSSLIMAEKWGGQGGAISMLMVFVVVIVGGQSFLCGVINSKLLLSSVWKGNPTSNVFLLNVSWMSNLEFGMCGKLSRLVLLRSADLDDGVFVVGYIHEAELKFQVELHRTLTLN